MSKTRQGTPSVVESYKLCEIFFIMPEYDGNVVFLNTFLSVCNTASSMPLYRANILDLEYHK